MLESPQVESGEPTDTKDQSPRVGTELFIELAPPVASIVIDRPAKRNAFTLAMWRRLAELIRSIDSMDDIRVVVIRSSSAVSFAAGADIAEFPDVRSDPKSGSLYNATVLDAERSIAACKRPTLAVVQGYALGGGCKIAMACDFRIGDESAQFGIPVAKLGVVYPPESIQRTVDVVGTRVAKLMFIAGVRPRGDEAYRLGLLDFFAAPGELEDSVSGVCAQLAKGSTHSIGSTKALFEHMMRHRVGTDAAELFSQVEHATYQLPEYHQNIATHRASVEPNGEPTDGHARLPGGRS